jgi:hypothetical protein
MDLRKRRIRFLAALLCLAAAAVPGAPSWSASRGEDLRIRLVTIGTGGPLYTWWGHTGLIVEDLSRDLGRFYNYGLFSFEEDNFFLNFARGRLIFAVGASSPSREMALYRGVDRSIRIQTLNLLPEKRREMALFLEENVRPENRNYLYDHYRDNCATRVRDLIDRVIDGQLAARTAGLDEQTFREHTRRHTFRHPLMDWLLMFLMGPSIDRPISRWDSMFLPAELERYVDGLTYEDGRGEVRPLISERLEYYHARSRKAVPASPPRLWPWGLLAGLAAAAAALGLRARAESDRPAGGLLLGLYQAGIGLLLGLPGTALLLMSLFTDHTVTYGNINLLLANPLTLLALPLGLCAAAGRRGCRVWADRLWKLLACLGLAALPLRLLPWFVQDNRFALAAILPLLVALAWPLTAWKRRSGADRREAAAQRGQGGEG